MTTVCFRTIFFVLLFTCFALSGCKGSGDKNTHSSTKPPATNKTFRPVVNTKIAPAQTSVPSEGGTTRPVARSIDEKGIQTDFVVGEVLIRPKSDADLKQFLARYGGKVISDNAIPEPPDSLGISLTPEQRKATEYLVRLDLSKASASTLQKDAKAIGLSGRLQLSSKDALDTLTEITNAESVGYSVSPDFIDYLARVPFPVTFPATLFHTSERNASNAFDDKHFQPYKGSASGVTLAWQFIAAHGIQRRTTVAIIDAGFLLDKKGFPIGSDSDFPANAQYDLIDDDNIADGAGVGNCGGKPGSCVWHGTGAAGVAVGLINNHAGAAGSGGLVADVILLKTDLTTAQNRDAVRVAVYFGADVVSMSYGHDCNYWCRNFDDDPVFAEAYVQGYKTVFVAAAGNGDPKTGIGYSVDDPHYYHPCVDSYVICVGALADGAKYPIGYSNFGDGVDIFAPTNIAVMAHPAGNDKDPYGPSVFNLFNGTSASTPLIAGVAAMMKAVNPDLDTEDVVNIFRNTVSYYTDAYEVVYQAAKGSPAVKDRLEPNYLAKPYMLAGDSPWNIDNLNVDSAKDLDYYRFNSPTRSIVQIDVSYPDQFPHDRGKIPLLGLDDSEACAVATELGVGTDQSLPIGGRRVTYSIGSGPYVFSLGGGLVNAYNLDVRLLPTPDLTKDAFEPNNIATNATALFGSKTVHNGNLQYQGITAKTVINANLDKANDLDYYTISGAKATLAERIYLNAAATVKIDENESPLTLTVFELNADGTQGAQVSQVSSQSCKGEVLSVTLNSGQAYLVKVSGAKGKYTLHNGIGGERRHIPDLAHDQLYEILHPGEAIERALRTRFIYVFTGDPSLSEIRVQGDVHLELFDFDGNLIAEGQPGEEPSVKVLSLSAVQLHGIYALRVTPTQVSAQGTPMTLSWVSRAPASSSANLIKNPGAEVGPAHDAGGQVASIQDWSVTSDSVELPTVIYYNGFNGLPDTDDPGPTDRGDRFFAGGPSNATSGITQIIPIDNSLRSGIDNSTVKFNLSAFLGGFVAQQDAATITATFLDANKQNLGQVTLGPMTAEERTALTGLFPVAVSGFVPVFTYSIQVDIAFQRLSGGDYNDGYADNLELTLSNYQP